MYPGAEIATNSWCGGEPDDRYPDERNVVTRPSHRFCLFDVTEVWTEFYICKQGMYLCFLLLKLCSKATAIDFNHKEPLQFGLSQELLTTTNISTGINTCSNKKHDLTEMFN